MSLHQKRNVSVGIYTSNFGWEAITHGARTDDAELWYLTTYDSVDSAISYDFSDFKPFANFTKPRVKQFPKLDYICGLAANRNVYLLSWSTEEPKKPVVRPVGPVPFISSNFTDFSANQLAQMQ
ncbi:unnamed protein product [Heligmosomoides polygyrus]|uniref:DPPIV_N domain-containing protein n=1 Tax=Heligmosomoides polygyrus TaxID=6339 RepID=A0A183GNT5_HELPZ|nr:unnamed protein product [Heligmosomoides polygyrus]